MPSALAVVVEYSLIATTAPAESIGAGGLFGSVESPGSLGLLDSLGLLEPPAALGVADVPDWEGELDSAGAPGSGSVEAAGPAGLVVTAGAAGSADAVGSTDALEEMEAVGLAGSLGSADAPGTSVTYAAETAARTTHAVECREPRNGTSTEFSQRELISDRRLRDDETSSRTMAGFSVKISRTAWLTRPQDGA